MYLLRLSQYCQKLLTNATVSNVRQPCRAFHATSRLRLTDMETVHTTERLAHLRILMKKHDVDIYSMFSTSFSESRSTYEDAVVPSEDSHQSEYIAPCDARRGQRLSFWHRGSMLKVVNRIHIRVLRIRWDCRYHVGQSLTSHRWPVFQPSRQAAG